MNNPVIIAALIAGVVAIVSPIITLFVKELIDQKRFGKILGKRQALLGRWSGKMTQDIVPDDWPSETDISVIFKKEGRRIIGSVTLSPQGLDPRHLHFVGGFFIDQFVKFEYVNADDSIIQFGSYIAQLTSTPDCRTLTGRYVGYGPDTREIVSGTGTLTKVT